MRGSLLYLWVSSVVHGIIPAHAGLTRELTLFGSRFRDHPRACGAHAHPDSRREAHPGSSPRMRGSLSLSISSTSLFGIIPAHAGLTVALSRAVSILRDHPRACGAHTNLAFLLEFSLGSSPRMRGSHLVEEGNLAQLGIIPAHAGLTVEERNRLLVVRDHPRACGAHCPRCQSGRPSTGSSPRMRGSRYQKKEAGDQ